MSFQDLKDSKELNKDLKDSKELKDVKIEKKGYGCKKSPEDLRDLKIRFGEEHKKKFMNYMKSIGISTEEKKISSFNLMSIFSPKEIEAVSLIDQGPLGSCTANAACFAYFFDEVKQNITNKFFPSRLFLYYNERYINNTVDLDSGASIRDSMVSLKKYGVCREKIWPYDIKYFKTKPPEIAYKEGSKTKSVRYMRIDFSKDYTQADRLNHMKTCILSGYPFIFGFVVYPSFESEYVAKTGLLDLPNQNETSLGSHAVCAVGFDDNLNNTKKGYFIIKNSWGNKWGDNGLFYMSYDYISNEALCDTSDFWVLENIKRHDIFCSEDDIYPVSI